jgi:tetratricopeptide (TPR) repeat protein
LSENLPSYLINLLGQSRYLRVLDENTVYGLLNKFGLLGRGKYGSEDLRKVAAEGGASHLLTGRFFTAAGRFVLNLGLMEAKTGNLIRSFREEVADKDAIFGKVEDMTKNIKAGLGVPAELIEKEVGEMAGEVYTRNPKALQYYLEGIHYREIEANNYKVIECMQRAVEIDPEFAMAYQKLGAAMLNTGGLAKALEMYKKALDLKERLPEKERLFVEGVYYSLVEETVAKAIEALKTLVSRYPDDFQGRFNLAIDYGLAGDFERAAIEYDRITQGQYRSRNSFTNYANMLAFLGEFTQARETFETCVSLFPEDGWVHFRLGVLYSLERNFEAARREIDKAISLSAQDPYIQGEIRIYRGAYFQYLDDDFDGALKYWQELNKTVDGRLSFGYAAMLVHKGQPKTILDQMKENWRPQPDDYNGHWAGSMFQGSIHLQFGRPGEAAKKYQDALSAEENAEQFIGVPGFSRIMSKKRLARFFLTSALCDTGDIAKAEESLREYRALIPAYKMKALEDGIVFLEAKIALAKSDLGQAVEKMEKAATTIRGEEFLEQGGWTGGWMTDQAYKLDAAASACMRAGKWADALAHYQRLQLLQMGGRWDWGAIYVKSYYWSGRALEELGRKDEARAKYEKFLDLWKDAEPGSPKLTMPGRGWRGSAKGPEKIDVKVSRYLSLRSGYNPPGPESPGKIPRKCRWRR